MRFLVRFRDVARMTGVDATEKVVQRGHLRCDEEGLSDRIFFVVANVCASGLPDELGFPVFWWEIPHRRAAASGEPSVELPGGLRGPRVQVDFVMNDRCTVGMGHFLEVVATWLDTAIGALGRLSAKSQQPAQISSMCVVFAETQIIGLLASGVAPEDIVAGVQASIAKGVAGMAGRSVEEPIVFTGGVALVPGMTGALESALGEPVSVAPQPQITAALGAAVLAADGENRE